MEKPVCKLCGSRETRRLPRRGFLQQVILYRLGFVPWECVFCRKTFFRKLRSTPGQRGSGKPDTGYRVRERRAEEKDKRG